MSLKYVIFPAILTQLTAQWNRPCPRSPPVILQGVQEMKPQIRKAWREGNRKWEGSGQGMLPFRGVGLPARAGGEQHEGKERLC